MELKSKSATFLGFAIKAKKYRVGFNSVASLKRAELIIVCKSVSLNSYKQAIGLKNKFHCELLQTATVELSELTFIKNSKIIAITDKSLAKAIVDNMGLEFISVK